MKHSVQRRVGVPPRVDVPSRLGVPPSIGVQPSMSITLSWMFHQAWVVSLMWVSHRGYLAMNVPTNVSHQWCPDEVISPRVSCRGCPAKKCTTERYGGGPAEGVPQRGFCKGSPAKKGLQMSISRRRILQRVGVL